MDYYRLHILKGINIKLFLIVKSPFLTRELSKERLNGK